MTGGGGVTATNHLAQAAPKDGTTLAIVARGMGIEPLLGGEQTRFDPLKLQWIGSTSPEVSVIAVRSETGVRTLDDMRTREVAVAGPAPGTDGVTYPNTLNNLLGTRFKIVTGYRSGPEMVMAVERREVEGRGSWSWASFRTEGAAMLKAGELNLLVQMSLRKSPELPNVPLIMEYAKTDEQRQILRVILTGQEMAWPLVAPAETPRERVELLRTTFLAMLADEEAKVEAKKLGIDLEPISGAEIQKLLENVYATPPAVIERVRELSGARSKTTSFATDKPSRTLTFRTSELITDLQAHHVPLEVRKIVLPGNALFIACNLHVPGERGPQAVVKLRMQRGANVESASGVGVKGQAIIGVKVARFSANEDVLRHRSRDGEP